VEVPSPERVPPRDGSMFHRQKVAMVALAALVATVALVAMDGWID